MAETAQARGFSRRSFIKGAAALTAAGALAGCTPKTNDKDKVDPEAPVSSDELFSSAPVEATAAAGAF